MATSVILILVWTYLGVCVDVHRGVCVCLYLCMCMSMDIESFRGVFIIRVFLITGFSILRFWPIWEVYTQSQPKGDSNKTQGFLTPVLVVGLLHAVLIS